MDIDGKTVFHKHGPRIFDMAISQAGDRLVAIPAGRKMQIIMYDLNTYEETTIEETFVIVSMDLSKDGKLLLTNTNFNSPELHLWNLDKKTILNKFTGYKQDRFCIRCCFGGTNDVFIITGSEDGNV